MRRALVVEYSAVWTDTVALDVPDGLTEGEVKAIVSAALDREASPPWDKVRELRHHLVPHPAYGNPVCPPDPPADDPRWILMFGARWLTDGACLVREDAPRPSCGTEQHPTWVTVDHAIIVPLFDEHRAWPIVPTPYVHGRFSPMVAAGVVRALPSGVFAIVRDNETIALLSPMRSDAPLVVDGFPLICLEVVP